MGKKNPEFDPILDGTSAGTVPEMLVRLYPKLRLQIEDLVDQGEYGPEIALRDALDYVYEKHIPITGEERNSLSVSDVVDRLCIEGEKSRFALLKDVDQALVGTFRDMSRPKRHAASLMCFGASLLAIYQTAVIIRVEGVANPWVAGFGTVSGALLWMTMKANDSLR